MESFVKLDLKMPLSMIKDQYLRIDKKEYEDRPNGSVEDKETLNIQPDKGKFLKWSYTDNGKHEDEDDDDDNDEDDSSEDQNEDSYFGNKPKRAGKKIIPLSQYE